MTSPQTFTNHCAANDNFYINAKQIGTNAPGRPDDSEQGTVVQERCTGPTGASRRLGSRPTSGGQFSIGEARWVKSDWDRSLSGKWQIVVFFSFGRGNVADEFE